MWCFGSARPLLKLQYRNLTFSDGPKVHITVGQTSQHTLAQFSPYPVFSPEDGNDSEAVLRMPIWKNLPPNARVLIIRGHGGRDFLADKLTELGFQINIAEIYFRRPHAIDWQNFKTEDIAAAYVTSGELAREFSIRFRRNFPDSSNPCYTLPTILALPMRFASSVPNM